MLLGFLLGRRHARAASLLNCYKLWGLVAQPPAVYMMNSVGVTELNQTRN